MKFLCLHGAFGNASVCNPVHLPPHHMRTWLIVLWQNFQAQLGPFVSKAKEAGDQISFKWISGRHEAIPPAGFSDYFGRGPLYRFIPFDGIAALDDVLHKLDEFPQGETAEDTIRQLIQSDYGSQYTLDGVRTSIEYILDAVREDPEIEVSRLEFPIVFLNYFTWTGLITLRVFLGSQKAPRLRHPPSLRKSVCGKKRVFLVSSR